MAMSSSRLPAALLLGALALGAGLAHGPPADAGAPGLRFSADTGDRAVSGPVTEWPDRVLVDPSTWTLLAIWTGPQAEERQIPMASIARFERARAFEGRPEELVLVLKDGGRVLVARGAQVTVASTLLTATVGRGITDVPSSAPWPPATRADGQKPETSLALGSVHTGAQASAALRQVEAEAEAPATRRSVLYDVNEALPPNADAEALNPQEIRISVQKQMARIRQCYQRELQRHPGLQGRVVVWFLIEADGSVGRARLAETTMGNIRVEDCIVDEVAAMRFSKPQAGKVVPVSFPFNFSGAGG